MKEKKKQYLNDLNLGLTKFVPTTCTCNWPMPLYGENMAENYYEWGKFNLSYENFNKLAICHKNRDRDSFSLALTNS